MSGRVLFGGGRRISNWDPVPKLVFCAFCSAQVCGGVPCSLLGKGVSQLLGVQKALPFCLFPFVNFCVLFCVYCCFVCFACTIVFSKPHLLCSFLLTFLSFLPTYSLPFFAHVLARRVQARFALCCAPETAAR